MLECVCSCSSGNNGGMYNTLSGIARIFMQQVATGCGMSRQPVALLTLMLLAAAVAAAAGQGKIPAPRDVIYTPRY